MARWILLLLFVGSVAWAQTPDDTNSCQDPASWTEWSSLLAQNPDDSGLQMLHALRIGLCVKVERGEITADEGTRIFEQARTALLVQLEVLRREARQQARPSLQPL